MPPDLSPLLESAVSDRNEEYVRRHRIEHATYFDTVESQPLTEEQREAVVCDEDNSLVLAWAGTGKTSTLVAKLFFLLCKEWTKPSEILLLAYTRDAAQEMRERLKSRLGVEFNVHTFHALGTQIIATATGKKPSLCREASDASVKTQTFQDIIESLLTDDTFLTDYLAFASSLPNIYRARWEFSTLEEYIQYLLKRRTTADSRA